MPGKNRGGDMSDKVFWSILGGILLGWVILFVLLVLPKMQAYDSVSADLKSKHRTLDKFSKRTDRDLPTQRLINKEEEFLQSWKKEIDRAEEFYESEVPLRRRSERRSQWLVYPV